MSHYISKNVEKTRSRLNLQSRFFIFYIVIISTMCHSLLVSPHVACEDAEALMSGTHTGYVHRLRRYGEKIHNYYIKLIRPYTLKYRRKCCPGQFTNTAYCDGELNVNIFIVESAAIHNISKC